MVEKTITLENISLIDFLGLENQNIKQLAAAFPSSKIISRGNEIKIQGQTPEITKIHEILSSLIEHYHQYGKITDKSVHKFLTADNDFEDDVVITSPDVIVYGSKGGVIKAKTPSQHKLVEAVAKNDLVFALGPAGTGKTFISVAMAVRALKNKEVKKIIISRPVVEAGESLGFLPGDMKDKVDPYLRPIYDALEEMIPVEKLKYYYENKIIEIAPLAYMRGRTLNNAFVLLDEAQNTTPMQIKMFMTRMGPTSKVMINGDRTQIDLPRNQRSGLIEAMTVLKDIKGIGFVEMQAEDVVRHRLVKSIVEAYTKFDDKRQKEREEREKNGDFDNQDAPRRRQNFRRHED
ncbi:PhoH family protein [Rufibacter quisquiliarum]|uniref:PhoH-like protein n=1 Tax=Rufibacter quisquiliarum TaxID=1549639 RepID=A0A839GR15_9BACT|nr:PhoH family protein [Rufibacter quisquiliarum]MBA9076281.1 phosphate starvation-inducible PhoH-like protein [Rufibacter quisquiliarum]